MYHILGSVQHLTPPKRGRKRVTLIDAYVDADTRRDALAIALRRNEIEPREEGRTWQWIEAPTIQEAQTL